MKRLSNIICFFFLGVGIMHAQTKAKPDALKQLSQGDTLVFLAHNSGCFNAGTNMYIITRHKNGEREITYNKAGQIQTKKITAKKFDAFISNYRNSMKRFSDPDEQSKCTMISTFSLKDHEQALTFKNGSCEAKFNPEETLLQLLK